MKTWSAIVISLYAAQAAAVGCARVEYADARDWPVEKARADYCRSGKFAAIDDQLLRDLRAQGLLTARDASQTAAESASCRERQALFARVLENVHHEPLPACK